MNNKFSPFPWFNDNAEEAAEFYLSVFADGKKLGELRSGGVGPCRHHHHRIARPADDRSEWRSSAPSAASTQSATKNSGTKPNSPEPVYSSLPETASNKQPQPRPGTVQNNARPVL